MHFPPHLLWFWHTPLQLPVRCVTFEPSCEFCFHGAICSCLNTETHNPACEFVLNCCVVYQKRKQLTYSSHHSPKLPVFEAMSQLSAALEENTLLYMHLHARLSFVNLQNRKGSVALIYALQFNTLVDNRHCPTMGKFPKFHIWRVNLWDKWKSVVVWDGSEILVKLLKELSDCWLKCAETCWLLCCWRGLNTCKDCIKQCNNSRCLWFVLL